MSIISLIIKSLSLQQIHWVIISVTLTLSQQMLSFYETLLILTYSLGANSVTPASISRSLHSLSYRLD